MSNEELEEKFEDAFDKNTRATGGGYEADYTDKWDFWRAFLPSIIQFAKDYHVEQIQIAKKQDKPL